MALFSSKVRLSWLPKHSGLLACVLWLLLCAGTALGVELIAPHSPSAVISSTSFGAIGQETILGTDYLGRDMLSRTIYAARTTISLALLISLTATVLGTLLGLCVALSSTLVDNIASRINDALMAFPALILAMLVVTGLGSSFVVLVLTAGFIQGTRVFRVARALGQSIRDLDFIRVARVRGDGQWRIMVREVLPNCRSQIAAEFGMHFTFAILIMSSLSFLGLGIQPPATDWGSMVRENLPGLLYGSTAPIIPALAIALTTVSLNALVDFLTIDPNDRITLRG